MIRVMVRNQTVRRNAREAVRLASALAFCLLLPAPSTASFMEWATVGDPGNVADKTGFGAVGETYRIGKFEVSNAQYVDFLNHVAVSDPYELYDARMTASGIQRIQLADGFSYSLSQEPGLDWGSKPVNFVSWYDAVRFVNWMNNGMGGGATETGAYTLLGGTPIPVNADSIVRNADARVWLPSTDEWYKAAYYDPNKPGGAGYWIYPTASNAAPGNVLLSPDPGGSANFTSDGRTSSPSGVKQTDVGRFSNSASAYGTFDQAGNLSEWSETLVPGLAKFRAQLGGSWGSLAIGLQASNTRFAFNAPAAASDRGGFRIAGAVPEPTSMVLVAVGLGAVLAARSQRRPRL